MWCPGPARMNSFRRAGLPSTSDFPLDYDGQVAQGKPARLYHPPGRTHSDGFRRASRPFLIFDLPFETLVKNGARGGTRTRKVLSTNGF